VAEHGYGQLAYGDAAVHDVHALVVQPGRLGGDAKLLKHLVLPVALDHAVERALLALDAQRLDGAPRLHHLDAADAAAHEEHACQGLGWVGLGWVGLGWG
jgi:hypothetical protein